MSKIADLTVKMVGEEMLIEVIASRRFTNYADGGKFAESMRVILESFGSETAAEPKSPAIPKAAAETKAPAVPKAPADHAHMGASMLGKVWTGSECETIRAMNRDGHPVAAIARQLGRTPAAVTTQMQRMRRAGETLAKIRGVRTSKGNIASRRPSCDRDAWTPQLDVELANLRKAGHTFPNIGKKLGRTAGACGKRVAVLRDAGVSI